MSSARSLLSRIKRLQTDGVNPILKRLGGLERFECEIAARVADGRMSEEDGPFIVRCVCKWSQEMH